GSHAGQERTEPHLVAARPQRIGGPDRRREFQRRPNLSCRARSGNERIAGSDGEIAPANRACSGKLSRGSSGASQGTLQAAEGIPPAERAAKKAVAEGYGETDAGTATHARGMDLISFAGRLPPLSRRTDKSVNHQAKPEVDHHSKIGPKRPVARNERQRRDKREIHHIAQNDGQQRLKEVQSHR